MLHGEAREGGKDHTDTAVLPSPLMAARVHPTPKDAVQPYGPFLDLIGSFPVEHFSTRKFQFAESQMLCTRTSAPKGKERRTQNGGLQEEENRMF